MRNDDPIETAVVMDVYADGVASCENLGPNKRVTFFTWQTTGGRRERVVVVRIVGPSASLRICAGRGEMQ